MVRCNSEGCWNASPCPVHGDALNAEQLLHPQTLADAVIIRLLIEKNVRPPPFWVHMRLLSVAGPAAEYVTHQPPVGYGRPVEWDAMPPVQ
jgi:hypothetical protein